MIERISTKEQLFLSLSDLSRIKPISKITIEEITKNCGLKRGIFYYYFRNKDDLILTGIFDNYENLMNRYFKKETWKFLMEQSLLYTIENRDLMNALSVESGGYSDELNDFMCSFMNRIVKGQEQCYPKDELKRIRLSGEFYASGITRIFQYWIRNSFQENYIQMAEIIDSCMPLCLREILDI